MATYDAHLEPEFLRVSANTKHAKRFNAPSITAEIFFGLNYYCPFIDHIVAHLKDDILRKRKVLFWVIILFPINCMNINSEIQELIKEEFFQNLLTDID